MLRAGSLCARRLASNHFFRPLCAAGARARRRYRATLPVARLDIECRPASYETELEEKKRIARSHFDDIIALPPTETFESAREEFRMRAEFKVWHDGERSYFAMCDSDRPKDPVEIADFPMASSRIRELMPTLLREVVASDVLRRKLFQANFLTTTTGDAVVSLLYHRQLDDCLLYTSPSPRDS